MGGTTQSLAAGERIGNYQITGLIGAGGMGVVYKALDLKLERTVALKFLPHDLEYRPEDIQAALSASTVFYEHLSAEQYDAIYDASSAQLRTSSSRDALVRFLRKVNRTTGRCGGPTLAVTTAGSDDVGKFVELRYTRNCPNVGEVRETLSWSIAADKPLLRSYFASNPALIGD